MMNEEENKVEVEKRGSTVGRTLRIIFFGVLFLGVPLVLAAPFLFWGIGYVYQSFSHDELTPSEFEAMLDRNPATLQELRIEMSKKYGEYQMDWSNSDEVNSFLETLESDTASLQDHGIVDMRSAVWNDGRNKANLVKYIYSIETKPISTQVLDVGGGHTYYYCLMDKDCRILGWVFPEE